MNSNVGCATLLLLLVTTFVAKESFSMYSPFFNANLTTSVNLGCHILFFVMLLIALHNPHRQLRLSHWHSVYCLFLTTCVTLLFLWTVSAHSSPCLHHCSLHDRVPRPFACIIHFLFSSERRSTIDTLPTSALY